MSQDRHARILVVRHPETTANVARRYVGRGDEPYTERGLEQKAALARLLRAWRPAAVLSSPSRRALETAREAAADGVVALDELREVDFGDAEGLTYEEAREAGVPLDYLGGPTGRPIAAGGESWRDLAERVGRAADEAERLGRTAIVTHGGVMRALLVSWLALPAEAAWRFSLPPATIATLSVSEGLGTLTYLGPPAGVPLRGDGAPD